MQSALEIKLANYIAKIFFIRSEKNVELECASEKIVKTRFAKMFDALDINFYGLFYLKVDSKCQV